MRNARRPLILALAILGALILQTTLFGRLRIAGVAPDLVLLVLLLGSIRLRMEQALFVGFAGGLLFDALSATAMGLRAFVYTAVMYLAIRTHARADFSPVATAVWVAVLTAIGAIVYTIVGTLFAQVDLTLEAASRRFLLIPVFNLVIALMLTPVITRLLEPVGRSRL